MKTGQPPSHANLSTRLQALFSFRFENYIPAGKTKRKAVAVRENIMRTAQIGPDLRLNLISCCLLTHVMVFSFYIQFAEEH